MSPLAPGILIAAPPLEDPNFDRSVVLLASHDRDGAFGWVINGEPILSLGDLLHQAGIARSSSGLTEPALSESVRKGGPVSTEQVWLIYPTSQQIPDVDGQLEIAPGITATASRQFLEKLADGAKVPSLRAFAGYAGWGPGQLEAEIQAGAWLPGATRDDLIFGTDIDVLWRRAYEMQGTTPIAFTTRVVGSA